MSGHAWQGLALAVGCPAYVTAVFAYLTRAAHRRDRQS